MWMTNTQHLKEIKMEAARAPEFPACQIASLSGIYSRPTSAQREDGKSWNLSLKIRDEGGGGTERKHEQESCYLPFPIFLNYFFLPNKPEAELKVLFPLYEQQGIGLGASARGLSPAQTTSLPCCWPLGSSPSHRCFGLPVLG